MNFKTEISYNTKKTIWNNTLLSNKASTAFQHSDFFHPYQLAYNSQPVFITVLDSSEKIVGQLSCIIHKNQYWLESNFISNFFINRFNLGYILNWHYGPIIHNFDNADEILSQILHAVDKIAIENNVNLISGSSPPQQFPLSVDIFKKNNYLIKPWLTYITNVDNDHDTIFNKLHNKTRYDVRKGNKSGLEFEVVSKKESYDLYVKIKYDDEKKLQKIKKMNKTFPEQSWDTSFKIGIEKMFLVRHNGNPIGAIDCNLFNDNVVQMGVANLPKSNPYAGSFLTWNTIKWLSENNFQFFDVGGANPIPESKKEEGINLFKSKWASKKIDFFLYTKVFDRTKLNLLNIIKQPKFLTNKITKSLHNKY